MNEQLARCPFVRAVAEQRTGDARELAAAPPDPAAPAVIDWLIAEAERQLDGQGVTGLTSGHGTT